MCNSNPVLLREKLGVKDPTQLYGTMPGIGFMIRVCLGLSSSFWCRYFLSYLMCRSHSTIFWISLRGNCSICSCALGASMGGRMFRSLLCCFLGPAPLLSFYLQQSPWESTLSSLEDEIRLNRNSKDSNLWGHVVYGHQERILDCWPPKYLSQ